MSTYAVIQCGLIGDERYETEAAAQAEADRLNEEAEAELGHEIVGDGAAGVIEIDE